MSTELIDGWKELVGDGPNYLMRQVPSPIELPCGYVDKNGSRHTALTLRKTTGVEEDMFTDESMANSSVSVLTRVLENCIVDFAGIQLPEDPEKRTRQQTETAKDLVRGMELADRTFALVALRRMSLKDGHKYRKKYDCPAPCDKEFTVVTDLSELVITPQPDASSDTFEFVLPDSKQLVTFRHLTVGDEGKIKELVRRHAAAIISVGMWLQIVRVDGKAISHRDVRKWSTLDRSELRRAMDATEGGIDLSMGTVKCPHCSKRIKDVVALDAGFFLNSATDTQSVATTENQSD